MILFQSLRYPSWPDDDRCRISGSGWRLSREKHDRLYRLCLRLIRSGMAHTRVAAYRNIYRTVGSASRSGMECSTGRFFHC